MKVSESTQPHARAALLRRVLGPVVLLVAVITAITTATAGTTGSATTIPAPTAGPTAGSATPRSPSAAPSSTGGADGVPGVDAPGVTMTVTPRPDGDLTVLETLWLPSPTDELRLAPPDLGTAGELFDGADPELRDIALAADGRPVPLERTTVTRTTKVDLPASAVTFTVRYTLHGAVVRSRPSVAGRALGVVRPLTLVDRPSLPVVIEISGKAVLSMSCPELGMAVTGCASPSAQGYALNEPVPASRSLVILQLDLDEA